MASDKVTVHLTADDMRPAFEAIVRTALDEITRQIVVLAERMNRLQERIDIQAGSLARMDETVSALCDGLDAWAGRIQRLEAFTEQHQTVLEQHGGRLNALESLPGVREMLPQDETGG